ncbi:MAG TPA: hypothetical protein DCQ26_00515 [Marinilabiliales bacterium]|nr:MAG: hypothetical protein A2W95_08255 [Bacteroidetes bacterium GWA2_40_14]OFX63772.1 MAG: hypothetical protein A2W84_17050 [Bacteroidetes bacterium GWC2_40_13]OFX75192.1 MAG: hypothetical protein A2W96_16465 [Bacteroidetes bacterium GWD2_40_43]OFX89789.1 MAG: hypothetical protein A2W97_12125 [Bacteroidetes bacterium GWE2_40_63]OFY22018.1 MAG: hypothetical protein A2W88_00720 [Bacteroidetes bacterium GWF2_40_13]OFZ26087.1 MAG: hypothetical protein A2437_10450 [Bacteroidetes bacterium RIFOXYC
MKLNTLVIISIYFTMISCISVRKAFIIEVREQLQNQSISNDNLEAKDIQSLPECVQRYMNYIGCIDKPKISNVQILFGRTKHIKEPNATPTDLRFCEQYNFSEIPYRNFYMNGKMKGLSFEGKENYIKGKGNMKIKLLNLFFVVNLKNKEIDQSALVTYLAECALIPSGFLNKNIVWQSIDKNTVKAIIDDNNNSVSGIFYFNEIGELIKFVSDDRYYITTENKLVKMQWIAEMGNYRLMSCGLKLSSYLKATWKLHEGDFLYFDGEINDINYNKTDIKN